VMSAGRETRGPTRCQVRRSIFGPRAKFGIRTVPPTDGNIKEPQMMSSLPITSSQYRCCVRPQVARRRIAPKTFCTMNGHPQMEDVAQEVVNRLVEKKAKLTTVESCTGGLLAHLMTNVGGAAQVFWVCAHAVYCQAYPKKRRASNEIPI
jgi:hypothetical protein